MRRIFRFAYYSSPKHAHEDPALHQLRDGDAAMEILSVLLQRRRYRYGGLLLNYPEKLLIERGIARQPFDEPFTAQDMILIVGRPPLDDEPVGPRLQAIKTARSVIHPSGSDLEQKLFGWLRTYFDCSSRAEMRLSNLIKLPPQHASKRWIEFKQNGGAIYKAVGGHKHPAGNPLSAAFLVYTPHVWPNGPSALCAFGMAGPETLIWAHLLRVRFSELVASKRFVFVELLETRFPSETGDLRFCDNWAVQSIVQLP